MSRRTTAIAAALSALALGSPLIAGCGTQSNITETIFNPTADLSSEDTLALNNKIAELTKIIETKPQHANAYYNRGNAKHYLKDYQGAIVDYNKAIEINPQHANAYYNRGNVKNDLKDYQGAIVDYNKAIEINPQHDYAYNNRGNAKNKLKDYQGAIVDYNKAIELNPQDATAYYNRGNAKNKLKDYQGAIVDYNKAIEINPQYYYAYYNRGDTKELVGDIKGACADFKTAASLDSQSAKQYLKGKIGTLCRNTKPSKISFNSIDNQYDLLRYIMQEKWNIYTWDYSQNKWRNHGYIKQLHPEQYYIKRGIRLQTQLTGNKPESYFKNHSEFPVSNIFNGETKFAYTTYTCRDDISLGEAVKEYRSKRSNDPIPYKRQTKWDIFANKYRFYEMSSNIKFTDFCKDSDGIFTSLAESMLDATDFHKIDPTNPVKDFWGSYPSSYFSNPDTLYGDSMYIRGVVFRKSDGAINITSCSTEGPCLPYF